METKTDVWDQYHTHIESKTKLLDLKLKEIIRYKDLIVLFTKKTFILTYKQTVLGPAWIFLNPFITSVIYLVLFGKIAGLSTNGAPQLLFYLGGNAIWSFFATSLNNTASTFTQNAAIFGKVYFPRLCIPISTVLTAAIHYGVQMIMFLAFWFYYIAVGQVHPHYYAIPGLLVVLLQLGALGLACGIIVSSLTTKYRDLAMLVSFGVQLWMYATPVVYPLSQLDKADWLYKFIMINPVTCSVETFRYIFFGVGYVSIGYWIYTIVFTLVLLIIGILLFNRVEKTFMDTV